ncbi:PREDICTED: synaptic vesicle glycoprotein 2A-like [Ceratosolen solmsi marchali]|uniref:Synaptic vesicle glycoprotein 2A-like n=1 Tax=Ceratosolen solmsi marchali TaxID=326594 RepID=A0AAJ7DT19_9HYME|nr:PREDICTED: synaptic vesicle glycoprotein 2A-like [Ceratosolen solmsi marchali]
MYMEESIAEKAVEQTGFGKFNIKITAVSALIFFNCAFCITSVGFVVPTAACDFKMTTIDKGRISAAPMLGMVIGSSIWGYLADLKGRRIALLISLFMQLTVDALASIVPSYWTFVFLKFLSGISVTGQLSIVFTYLGEFQPTKYRNQILSWMELSWAIGVIILALIAWLIIPLRFQFKLHMLSFSSWNLFVLTNCLPALIVALWMLNLPETPKYLAENGRLDALMDVLTRMYIENTGNTAEQFKNVLSTCSIPSISALVNQLDSTETLKTMSMTNKERLKIMLNSSKSQMKALTKKPYAKRLGVTGSIMFCMTSTYYSLMTWFPELFQRFATFEKIFPGQFASVCTVSQRLAITNNSISFHHKLNPFGCDNEIDTSVYVNSIWLGVACLPCAILLPLTVERFGYRIYMLFTATISCVVTVAFFFVKTSMENLILSCIFEAFTSLNISVIFCLLVELFPTNLRVVATAITLFIGRIGSLFGNMLFGYLIDGYCMVLIIIMAAQLFFAATLCWATPSRDKMRKIQGRVSIEVQNKAFTS